MFHLSVFPFYLRKYFRDASGRPAPILISFLSILPLVHEAGSFILLHLLQTYLFSSTPTSNPFYLLNPITRLFIWKPNRMGLILTLSGHTIPQVFTRISNQITQYAPKILAIHREILAAGMETIRGRG